MKAESISHIAILVKDLEGTKKEFNELFGVDLEKKVQSRENDTDGYLSSFGIEVVAPLTEDGPVSKNLEKRGEGFVMLALNVPDIEKAIEEMQAKGIRMLGRSENEMGKMATFHPRDFHGVMLELIQKNKSQD